MTDHFCFRLRNASIAILLLLTSSCRKTVNPGTFTTGYWVVDLNTANTIPGDTTRKDHAYAVFNLLSDSTLHYDVYFGRLGSGDAPAAIQLFQGSPAENGKLALNIQDAKFDSQLSSVGSVSVTHPLLDSLVSQTALFYVVINSTQKPAGLVRGKMGGTRISYALDVTLSGNNVNPPVTTAATGSCIFRLLADNVTCFYNVSVANFPGDDVLVSAALRKKSDNSVVLQLASSPADFNISKLVTLASATSASLQTDQLYVDIRTQSYPGGLLLGNLR